MDFKSVGNYSVRSRAPYVHPTIIYPFRKCGINNEILPFLRHRPIWRSNGLPISCKVASDSGKILFFVTPDEGSFFYSCSKQWTSFLQSSRWGCSRHRMKTGNHFRTPVLRDVVTSFPLILTVPVSGAGPW